MAKATKQPTGNRVKAAVFNMSTPLLRVKTGGAETTPEEGKVIPWGKADDLPHEYLRLIQESGTASSCMRRKQQFIFADGFVNKQAATFKVNEIQTADALFQDISGDVATLSGLSLRVRYVEGKVLAEPLPFECVRKLDNGLFVYNPTFGQKKVNKELNEILPGYSTRELLLEAAKETPVEIAEKGQIYYYFEKVKGAYDYPVPVYASKGGLADIENDTRLALYDLDEVKTGFRPSAVITTIGNYDSSFDEDGRLISGSDFASLRETIKSFTEREEGEPAKKVLHLTAETAEMVPKLEMLNPTKTGEQLTESTERIANKVCRNCNVPPVLVGLAKPGQLGQVQEVANMIKLFNMDTVGSQNAIQRIFAELWPEVADWTTGTLNPIDYIPTDVLAKMTDAEIRAIGGLAPLEATIPTEADKTLQALNALSPLVANKVLESMNEDEIRALIGLTPKAKPDAVNN